MATKPKPLTAESHPLYPFLMEALEQAMYGKGQRHGGVSTPFKQQQWWLQANLHGVGFLTGQASKKLGEAVSTHLANEDTEAFMRELGGAIVYTAMAMLHVAESQT